MNRGAWHMVWGWALWALVLVLLLQGCAQGPAPAASPVPSRTASAAPATTLAATPTFVAPSPSVAEPSPLAPSATMSRATPTTTASATATTAPTRTSTPSRPLPSPTIVHTVREGDTLLAIALRYGASVETLQRANGIDDPQRLKLGQVLVIPPPDPTPRASPTASPSPTARLPGETALACPSNTTVCRVLLDAEPIRLVIQADQAYLLAGGDLFVVPLADLGAQGDLVPLSAMPPERKVGPYTIQELVYAAADPETGDLVLLDKSNDIYRRTASGEWRMAVLSAAVSQLGIDPQYLALQSLGGSLYALDADYSRIWEFAPGAAEPETYIEDDRLGNGVDLAIRQREGGFAEALVLDRRGRVLRFGGDEPETLLASGAGVQPWPAQLSWLGERMLAVEGQQRRVTLLGGSQPEKLITVEFRLAGMRRLRSAALAGDILYALAGPNLYVVPLGGASGDCPAVQYDDGYYYAGRDLRDLITEVRLPFPDVALPGRPRSYPGARRLYRYGVHEGVDLYPGDVANLAYGSPVAAIGAGVVVRADTDFVEMTRAEYQAAIARAEAEHRTPPDVLDKLRGQQVQMAHGPGIETHYCHLQAIAPGIQASAQVAGGDVLGEVGASGTLDGVAQTGAGEHLHWEIWIDGRYLGHGLSLYETMRLWQAIFAP